MSHKIVNLNTELNANIDKVEQMLLSERPDILCVQEISKEVFCKWKKDFFKDAIFAPMVSDKSQPFCQWGIAIFSVYKITSSEVIVYDKFIRDYKEFKGSRSERPIATLLVAGFDELKDIKIATTHFTWSANAKTSHQQKINIKYLLNNLEKYDKLILTGDFNAPRGKNIFNQLSKKLKDNIPTTWESTLDPKLHRAKNIKIIVDGLFTIGHVKISDIRQTFGVSDHCAIVANFE
jgi:endonuclease/exonuclease/phosphatase family metal-dependent hydrolase